MCTNVRGGRSGTRTVLRSHGNPIATQEAARMRQLGNATDGNGNTGGLLDAAFDPGSLGLADFAIAAAVEVNLS